MAASGAEFFTLSEVNRLKLGIADRRRGKPSNYQLPEGLAERAIQIIRENYSDSGPTLACEKLAALHGVMLSKETVLEQISGIFEG